jgi:D-aspartate ligase
MLMNSIDVIPPAGKFDIANMDTSTPVLVLGGRENALSLVRRYGALGITTRVCGTIDCWGMFSRHCTDKFLVPTHATGTEQFHDLLLSGNNVQLHGSLLIPCSDTAIEFIAENRGALEKLYVLDCGSAKMQLAMLDKRETLELAKKAGVAGPQFWNVKSEADLEEIRQSVMFPVMVKPVLSHEFTRVFDRKLFIVESDFDEVAEKVRLCWANNLDIMVTEMIPGPDSLLSSYYTYIDADHKSHCEYTKRIIRRYPVNRGLGCCHRSEWRPETAKVGRKFFKGIGFTGLANIEFKLDPRDNVLKLIECNARFTAAQELVARSGAPLDLIYYCSVTGQPVPEFSEYDHDMIFWYGLRDFLAFLEMRKKGDISLVEWFKSLFPFKHVSPLHKLSDPYPSIRAFGARVDKMIRALL